MKLIDILGNVPILVFSEETNLINKIKKNNKIKKKSLSEREQYIANILVNKGAISRIKMDDTLYFVLKSNNVLKD